MLILIILCGLGAFLGGILRNFLARLNGNFALGTLSANLLGTFILGWATTTILLHDSGQQLTAFLSLGFCGGLTTFRLLPLKSSHTGKKQRIKQQFGMC